MFGMKPKLLKDVVGIGQDVHQVRNRRALVAGDIRHARLQQGFGDGENAFPTKFIALAKAKFLDFIGK